MKLICLALGFISITTFTACDSGGSPSNGDAAVDDTGSSSTPDTVVHGDSPTDGPIWNADQDPQEYPAQMENDAEPLLPPCDPMAVRPSGQDIWIGPNSVENYFMTLFGSAQHTIELQMYQFNRKALRDALIQAQNNDVEVRVLLDYKEEMNYDTIDKLETAGVSVKPAPGTFTHSHAKYAVIDDERAVTFSGNFDSFTMSSARNYGAEFSDPDDVADLDAIFERDWAGTGVLDTACTRLVFSPQNSRDRILDVIEGAGETLYLELMYLSDTDVLNAIKQRASSGVDVRLLLADPGWMTENDDTATHLSFSKVDVRYFDEYNLHAKLIIADDAAFIGSQNMSMTSLDKNREVGVVVVDPTAVTKLKDQFGDDWNAGTDP